MANQMFRYLRPDEVDVRVGQISKSGTGFSLLLYKDARCDMNILDETVGAMNWERSHSRDNRNCTVSIRDAATGHWVSKEDVGVESNTAAEKGLASDSFKRACVNWGIGRELYTAPFIWIRGSKDDAYKLKARVSDMAVKDGNIVKLTLVDQRGQPIFSWSGKPLGPALEPQVVPEPTVTQPPPRTAAPPPAENFSAERIRFVVESIANIGELRDMYRRYQAEHAPQEILDIISARSKELVG